VFALAESESCEFLQEWKLGGMEVLYNLRLRNESGSDDT
jgi:hypothetical protein